MKLNPKSHIPRDMIVWWIALHFYDKVDAFLFKIKSGVIFFVMVISVFEKLCQDCSLIKHGRVLQVSTTSIVGKQHSKNRDDEGESSAGKSVQTLCMGYGQSHKSG